MLHKECSCLCVAERMSVASGLATRNDRSAPILHNLVPGSRNSSALESEADPGGLSASHASTYLSRQLMVVSIYAPKDLI